MSYAGVWIRFVALLADGIISFLVLLFTAMVLGLGGGVTPGGGVIVVLFWMVLMFLYTVAMETTYGGTLGKQLVGLRVVDEYGGRIRPIQAVIRYLLRFVDSFLLCLVGALFIWSSPTRQRLGDLAASTFVVYANSLGQPTRPQAAPTSLPSLPAATGTTLGSSSTVWEEFRN
jgi:uncharacterized RDD family membrane protein YckC